MPGDPSPTRSLCQEQHVPVPGVVSSTVLPTYFSSCRNLCRSSWVAMGKEMSEAMLGVGSFRDMWLGEQEACRLEELLPMS